MRQEVCDKILSVLKINSNLSLTKLAKECGFSKGSSIEKEVKSLLENKNVTSRKNGKFDVFNINKVESVVSGDKIKEKLSEPNTKLLQGYKISDVKIKGKIKKKITCPDGKCVKIDNDDKLLVINNEPKFIVKTADEVLTCIKNYSIENDLTVFTVEDMCQNTKIATDKDVIIQDRHILFLTIKKHNKAA